MSHDIGIDLGGSKIALGLVDPRDEFSARRRIDTASEAGFESVVERNAIEVDALKATLPCEQRVEAVGIGGSVALAGDLLLDAAGASLKKYSFKAVSARVQVAAIEMGEDAPIQGAAWLARNRLLGSS